MMTRVLSLSFVLAGLIASFLGVRSYWTAHEAANQALKDGMLLMVDDDRIDLQLGEVIEQKMVRFRTLGCWPLTGAVESEAQTLPEIIEEMLVSTTSERQGRAIDRDQTGSMELKKRQGYF